MVKKPFKHNKKCNEATILGTIACMNELMQDILDAIRNEQQTNTPNATEEASSPSNAKALSDKELERIIRKHNRNLKNNEEHFAKKKLFPYYLHVKNNEPDIWQSWNIDETLDKKVTQLLQVKPRRTASGVATITVMAKPWKCSSNCLYCPNDLRMPKSYLSDEPVCQRAERNYFDPYLQVAARLRALTRMGHVTDKVELIVLGGTWSDYPKTYQIWFIKELFRALNEVKMSDAGSLQKHDDESAHRRIEFYRSCGLSNTKEDAQAFVKNTQELVDSQKLSYNKAWDLLYANDPVWKAVSAEQTATFEELEREHAINEKADHRVVGLVIETRPDTISIQNLALLRHLGCTKIQMGIQSVNADILKQNKRTISIETIKESFSLLRIFGFKIHAHFMVNLFGSTCEKDKQDYLEFSTNKAYLPDEVKLYPCVLVEGTKLCDCYTNGTWRPYTHEELLDVLTFDTLNTPPFTRISRMIRDISAHDIVAGNKKANLRQLVENRLSEQNADVTEIRYREISTSSTDRDELSLEAVEYETTMSTEYFLQWVTPEKKIAGFLRLSLPAQDYIRSCIEQSTADKKVFPIQENEAMIREVHVYGTVAGLHKTGKGAQHLGLGKQLIKTAASIAEEHGYSKLNVISSVGTREYYRKQGFIDNGLYQQMELATHE